MTWTLLIVEDDESLRADLLEILSARGFKPLVAANGAEAVAIGTGGVRPAVILLDLLMPVMDGFEFLDRQHEFPALDGVPVIVLTGRTELTHDLSPTVRAVLDKPFSLRKLLDLVHDACHGIIR